MNTVKKKNDFPAKSSPLTVFRCNLLIIWVVSGRLLNDVNVSGNVSGTFSAELCGQDHKGICFTSAMGLLSVSAPWGCSSGRREMRAASR